MGAGTEKRRQGQWQLYLIKGGNKEETKPESSRRHEEMFGVIKAHDITPRKTHVNGHYLGYPSTVNVCIKYTYLLITTTTTDRPNDRFKIAAAFWP